MEYKIYNESLVYYTLRDKKGKYLGYDKHDRMMFETNLQHCFMFDSIRNAERGLKEWTDKLDEWEIRKVKVIDIGEVDERN